MFVPPRYPTALRCQAARVCSVCSSQVGWWVRQPWRMPTSRLARVRSAWGGGWLWPCPRTVDTGLCGLGCCRGLVAVLQFERDGADLADRAVPTATVVTVFDPGADLEPRNHSGGPDPAVVELGFQGGEERLSHHVIPADPGDPSTRVMPFSRRSRDPGGRVLSYAVGMVAGADSIDDMAVLRHGAMGRLHPCLAPPLLWLARGS